MLLSCCKVYSKCIPASARDSILTSSRCQLDFSSTPPPGRAHSLRVTVRGRRDVCKWGAERLFAWSVASAYCDNITHRRRETKAGGARSPTHQKTTSRPAWTLTSWKSEPTDPRRSSTALTSKNNSTYITILLSPPRWKLWSCFCSTAVRISALWWVNTGALQGCELSPVLFTLCAAESSARREPRANNRTYCICQKWAFWGVVRNRNKDKRPITEKRAGYQWKISSDLESSWERSAMVITTENISTPKGCWESSRQGHRLLPSYRPGKDSAACGTVIPTVYIWSTWQKDHNYNLFTKC